MFLTAIRYILLYTEFSWIFEGECISHFHSSRDVFLVFTFVSNCNKTYYIVYNFEVLHCWWCLGAGEQEVWIKKVMCNISETM